MNNTTKEKIFALGTFACVVFLFSLLIFHSIFFSMILVGTSFVLAFIVGISMTNWNEKETGTHYESKGNKSFSRSFISVIATVVIFINIPLSIFAADPGQLKINNQIIDKIVITGDNDGITIANNSYKITAKDQSFSSCGSTKYKEQTRTMTFTNNYNGWIKLTYTIDANGTVNAGTNCTIADGIITMQKEGTFTIAVTSSSNTEASSAASKSSTFSPTAIEYEELTPLIEFTAPVEHGTFTVTDKDGNAVSVPGSAESSSYTLTAVPSTNYQVFRWVFTTSSGTVTYFGEKTNTLTYTASEAGNITCEFMRSGSAIYAVDSVKYAYFDEALRVAGTSKKIVVVGSGSIYGLTDQNSFEIPNGVTLVLPYADGQTVVQSNSISTNSYFPYGNYAQGTGYSAQPGALTSSKYLELIIPKGTTLTNKGIIAVGGTLQGNAATSGAHSNLKVDGTLELKSNTSVLSAIGYIYGGGNIIADGSGAKILQPLSLLRSGSWGWSVANTGQSISSKYGMQTYPADGYNGGNPSPRYATQNIQCNLEMKFGDTMYGYADQYCEKHYMCTVILVGSDSSNSLIALDSGAILNSTYDSSKKSTLYGNVGKLTITINGGATQGTMQLSLNGWTLNLKNWPFPVPYNYDLILENGNYNLQYDLSLLSGAGLKIASDATLNIPSGVHLAVFTGANDHSTYGVHQSSSSYSSVTTSYKVTPASPNYPANSTLATVSTLNGVTGGSKMANLIVDGTLDVKSGGYFGGIAQTTGSGEIIMNGNTGRFTRQMGLTGSVADTDLMTQYWKICGATIYEFYPQYFDESGSLKMMEAGKTYRASNATTNAVSDFKFDLYTNADDVTAKTSHTETINATAVGQWAEEVTINFDANGGTGTMEAQKSLSGIDTELKQNTFEREGFTFAGWNTSADGSGVSYEESGTLNVSANITLYAQWIEDICEHANKSMTEGDTENCVDDGHKAYWYCSDCNKYFSDEACTIKIADLIAWLADGSENGGLIPATDHNMQETTAAVEATCGQGGKTAVYTCANGCGKTEGGDAIPELGHDIVVDQAVAPTCEGTGLTEGSHCSRCSDATVAQTEVPALGHKMQETTAAVGATCGEAGKTAVYTCANGCGKTEGGDAIPALGHTKGEPVIENKVDSTCTVDGSYETVISCTGCGAEISREKTTVDALGHDEVNHDAKTPTCTEKGWDAYVTCTRCDYTTYVEKAALDHKYEVTASKDATCTEDGFVTYTCGNDNSHTYTETMTKTGHAMVHREAVAAGCETEGTLEHWYCSNCQKNFADEAGTNELDTVVVGELGHDEVNHDAKAPTCTEIGWDAYVTCSRCDYTTYVGKGSLGHNYEVVVTPPTYDAEGYTTHTCSRCGDKYVDDYKDKLTAVAAVGEKKYGTLAEAVAEAKVDDTIKLLVDGEYAEPIVLADGVILDLNENNIKGTVIGTISINNGTLITAEGYRMAGPNADYYQTSDAVVTIFVNGDVTVEAGTMTVVPNEWWTGAGQTLTICEGATFVLPEGKTMQVLSSVIVEGTADIKGTVNLYSADATVVAAEGLNIKTTAGDKVWYTGGKYVVHNHNVVIDEAVDPTCTETGRTAGKHCSVCNDVLEAQTEVDALGHTEGEVVVENNVTPDCENAGSYDNVVYCTVCEEELSRETVTVDALGHTGGETVVENNVVPDCENAGSYDNVVYCTVCEEELSRETVTVGALGHDEVSHEAKAPTCTEAGWDAYVTCSRCNYTTYVEKEALGHDEVSHEAKAPTCGEIGWDAYETCSRCSYTTYVEKEALGHDEVAHEAKAPTCGEIGWDAYVTCSRCNYTTYVEKEALGHDEVAHDAKAPTCGEIGWDAYETCSRCSYTTYVEKEALGHTEGEVVVENKTEADCGNAGSYDNVVYCTVCGEEVSRETVTVDALGHTDGEVVVENNVAPDCENAGSYDEVVYCTVCGEELSRETITAKALGHTEATREENRVEATCGNAGSYDLVTYCSTCSTVIKTETQTIGATGNHNYKAVVTEPTCTEAGYTTYTCDCGDTYTADKTEALGHTDGEVVVENNVAPDCENAGSYDEVVYCTVCGEELSRETITVKALGHIEATREENRVEATCGNAGSYDLVTYCSACSTVIKTETQTIGATGEHNYETEKEHVEATCTEDGYVIMACTCGAEETTVLTAKGHNIVIDEAVAPTCNETGLTEGSHCSRCDDMKVPQEEVPATGEHIYATETERVDATCTVDGYVIKACSCGATEKTVLTAKGHSYGEGVVTKEATATEDGEMTYTCGTCGTTKTEVIPATGAPDEPGDQECEHVAGEAVVENEVDATCTKPGSYDNVTYCTVCGEELSRETVDVEVKEHSYGEGVVTKEATDTEDGEMTYTCGTCGTTKTEVIPATGGSVDGDEPEIVVTNPKNGTNITYGIKKEDNGNWTLALSADDTTKTYVYLVKYTDSDGNESVKQKNASGKYSDGEFAIPANAVSVTVQSVLLGDVTGDGSVKSGDYKKLKDYLMEKIDLEKLGELGELAGDVTGDGRVKSGDYKKIKDYLMDKVTKL